MPSISQIESYVGRPYDKAAFDCADLAVLVQQELFGKQVFLPGQRLRRQAPAAVIERYRHQLSMPVARADLVDGDVVLMKGEVLHIGTLFSVSGAWRVLHNSQTVGCCVLHRLTDLSTFGLFVEGFYRWK